MSDLDKIRKAPEGALFDQLVDLRAGMLGVDGSDQHPQPMSHHADRETGEIYFITSSDTDLVAAIGQGATGRYVIVGDDQDFYASIVGALVQDQDEAKLDEIWSIVAAAWFDEGREDHKVTLLRFTPREAAIWATSGNPFVFGLEIARANMSSEHKPDLGEHLVVQLNRAA